MMSVSASRCEKIIDMFLGGDFLKFIGTIIIYLYEAIFSLILGEKISSFNKIWSNKNGMLLKIVGFIFIMFLVLLLDLLA
jgi:hypothetical protein